MVGSEGARNPRLPTALLPLASRFVKADRDALRRKCTSSRILS